MILIVGLGNPGKQYEQTRHNIGFDVIDYMANKYNIDVNRGKFKGICGEGFIENKKGYFIKTFNIYEFKWRKHKRTC